MSVMGRLVRIAAPFGVFALSRLMTRHAPRVLMYHRFSSEPAPGAVSAAALDCQLAQIARHYHTFTMAEAIQRYYEGEGLPPNSVVITIDDGYRDFYDVAWPLFRKHGVQATLYVTTGFIDGETWLWPDRVKRCIQGGRFSRAITLGHVVVPAGRVSEAAQDALCHALYSVLLSVSDDEKNRMLQELEEASGLDPAGQIEPPWSPCSWDDLQCMQDEGLEIGGHTVSHPSLGRVSLRQAESEIHGCAERISQELGQRIRSFCYPNGTPSDYTTEVMEIVRQAGFVGAVTAFHDDMGWKHRYAIRRFSGCEDAFQFRKALHGVEWLSNRSRRHVLSNP